MLANVSKPYLEMTKLRLHLDVHPMDLTSRAKLIKLCEKAGCPLKTPVYDSYCPLQWTWIDSPWPWEVKTRVDL